MKKKEERISEQDLNELLANIRYKVIKRNTYLSQFERSKNTILLKMVSKINESIKKDLNLL